MFKLDSEKAEEPEIESNNQHLLDHQNSKRVPEKHLLLLYWLFVFQELSCFFDDPTNVDNLIAGFSAFSKSSLNIWKFMIHILLTPGLENFEYYSASVWDECSCVVVWMFFSIAFLWDWNENWSFSVLWPLLSVPNLLALLQHHLLGFEIAQLEFHHFHWLCS